MPPISPCPPRGTKKLHGWFVVVWIFVLDSMGSMALFSEKHGSNMDHSQAPGIDLESVKESSVGSCVQKLMNGCCPALMG
jgi:hypothetical protein